MRPTRSRGKGPQEGSRKSPAAADRKAPNEAATLIRQSSRVRKPGRYSELYITDSPRKNKKTQVPWKQAKAEKSPVSSHQVKETSSPRGAAKVTRDDSTPKNHTNTRLGQGRAIENSPGISKRKGKPAQSTPEKSQPSQKSPKISKREGKPAQSTPEKSQPSQKSPETPKVSDGETQKRGRKRKAENYQPSTLSSCARRKMGAPPKLGITDEDGDSPDAVKDTPVELIQHLQTHSSDDHHKADEGEQLPHGTYGEVFTSVAAEISSKILSAIPGSQTAVLQQACKEAQATLAGSRGEVKVIYGNWEAILKVKMWLEKAVEENLQAVSIVSANEKQSSQDQEAKIMQQETSDCGDLGNTDESSLLDQTVDTAPDITPSEGKEATKTGADTTTSTTKEGGTEVSEDEDGAAVLDTASGVQPAEHRDQAPVPDITMVLQQDECTDNTAILDVASGLLSHEQIADVDNSTASPIADQEVASPSGAQLQVADHKVDNPPQEICPAEDIDSLLRTVGEQEKVSGTLKTYSKADKISQTLKTYSKGHMAIKTSKKCGREEGLVMSKCGREEGLVMSKYGRKCKARKFTCDQCGYKTTYAGLQKHKQRRHSEVQYTCEVCDKTFGIKYDLRRHFMVHLDADGKMKGLEGEILQHEQKEENSLSDEDEKSEDGLSTETEVALVLSELLDKVVKANGGDGNKKTGFKVPFPRPGSALEIALSGKRNSDRIRERAAKALIQSHCHKSRASGRKGHKTGKFVCKDCGYRAITNCGLTKHRHRHHSLYTFTCDICEKEFGIKSDMERHRKVHRLPGEKTEDEETGPVTCEVCNKEFGSAKTLSNHMFRTHATKTVHCDLCGKWFGMECDLQRHITITHLEPDGSKVMRKAPRPRKPPKEPQIERPCPHCDKVFNRASSFALHMRIHKEKELIFCEHCPFNTKHRWALLKHFRRNHQERKFKCERCGSLFREETQLNLHVQRTHLGQKKRICELCGKVFMSPQVLTTHIKRVHMKIQRFFCDICNKGFYERVRMMEHKEIHKPEEERIKPFTCAYCGRRFAKKMDLQQHENTHTGEKPYKCKICQKGFAWATEVKKHMVCHSDERPHKCQMCNKAFKLKHKLTTHMITHTQVSKYCCSTCDRVFTTMATLKRHRCKKMEVLPINVTPVLSQEAVVEEAVKEEEIKEEGEEGTTIIGEEGTTIIAVETSEITEMAERAEQDNLTVYMCGICSQVFPDADSIHLHMYEHTGDGVTVVIENTTETGEVETLEEKVDETEGWATEQEVSTDVQAAATALTDLSGEPAIQK